MRVATTVLLGVLALGSARTAREGATLLRDDELVADAPYAPSPGAARYLSLGYHELAADVLFARLMPYFGGGGSTGEGVAALVEAIVALDPKFKRAYDWGTRAMAMIDEDVPQAMFHRILRLLEVGQKQFPDEWKIPFHAGQIYMIDLKTDDPAQRREWDEKASLLLETAIRKPKAPAEAAMSVSFLRTRLGQRERAIEGLREMLLITPDDKARARIIDELAKLEDSSADEIAAEIYEARRNFEREWKAERPAMSPSLYILVGPRAKPGFDMGTLATGGRDLVGSVPFERLDPPSDPPTTVPPTDSPTVPPTDPLPLPTTP